MFEYLFINCVHSFFLTELYQKNSLDVDDIKSADIVENKISALSETENSFVSETQAIFVAGKFQNLPQTRSEREENIDVQTLFDENIFSN